MAERKMAVVGVSFLVTLVVVAVALVPVANADACNDECYKGCEKQGKKLADAASCTSTCDDMCSLKSTSKLYAAATPTEKAAVAMTFEKEAAAASPAAESAPGFKTLKDGCLRECHNSLCRAGKKDDPKCNTRCENVCLEEVEGLEFAANAYAELELEVKEAVIEAINKQAKGPGDKIEELAVTCIDDCAKLCDEEGAPDDDDHNSCFDICQDGCRGRSVNLAYTLSTPAQKEAIDKDIKDAKVTASKLLGIA